MRAFLLSILCVCAAARTHAQSTVIGLWREPEGSMLDIHRCGPAESDQVCASIFHIRRNAPSLFDIKNPDPALRSRPYCRLEIGSGFHLQGPDRAEDGHLYDPRSGRTYSGSMRAEGSILHLRGYFLIKLFGRTEDWTRLPADTPACSPPPANAH